MGWYIFGGFNVLCLVMAAISIHMHGINFYHYGSIPSAIIMLLISIVGVRYHIKRRKSKEGLIK